MDRFLPLLQNAQVLTAFGIPLALLIADIVVKGEILGYAWRNFGSDLGLCGIATLIQSCIAYIFHGVAANDPLIAWAAIAAVGCSILWVKSIGCLKKMDSDPFGSFMRSVAFGYTAFGLSMYIQVSKLMR